MDLDTRLKYFKLTEKEKFLLKEEVKQHTNELDKTVSKLLGDDKLEWIHLIWIIRTALEKIKEEKERFTNNFFFFKTTKNYDSFISFPQTNIEPKIETPHHPDTSNSENTPAVIVIPPQQHQ